MMTTAHDAVNGCAQIQPFAHEGRGAFSHSSSSPTEQRRRPLTARQAQVFAFVLATIARTGRSPSSREIAEHLGLVPHGHQAAQDHLLAIAKKGWLVQTGRPGESRSWRPVGPCCPTCGGLGVIAPEAEVRT